MVDEHVLPAPVALELAVQLGYGHVAFVDDQQIVVGEIVEQGERRVARAAAVDVHRVVLDAVAVPHLLDHLEVVLGAHAQPLCLEQLPFGLELGEPLLQLGLDAQHCLAHAFVAGHVVGGREDHHVGELAQLLARERVDHGDAVDRVAEHLDAQHRFVVRRMHLDGVAAHTELATAKRHVVAVELQVDQAAQDAALVVVDTRMKLEQLPLVFVGVAHAVDTAHRRHHDGVAPGEQCRRGRVP